MGRGRDVLLLALCYVVAAAAAAAWNCTNNGTGTCITIVLLSRARFILKWIPLLRILNCYDMSVVHHAGRLVCLTLLH